MAQNKPATLFPGPRIWYGARFHLLSPNATTTCPAIKTHADLHGCTLKLKVARQTTRASSRLLHQQRRPPVAARSSRTEPSEEASNGARVPLQRLRRQQGEEAAAQEGAAQGADSQDSAGQPRGARRSRRSQQGAQLREMSKLLCFCYLTKPHPDVWCVVLHAGNIVQTDVCLPLCLVW